MLSLVSFNPLHIGSDCNGNPRYVVSWLSVSIPFISGLTVIVRGLKMKSRTSFNPLHIGSDCNLATEEDGTLFVTFQSPSYRV